MASVTPKMETAPDAAGSEKMSRCLGTREQSENTMSIRCKQVVRFLTWGAVSIGAILAIAFVATVQPGGDGVLGSVKTSDGSEYVVEQRCNWSSEPYTVSFYMRSADGNWGWCYIDHEASRWKDVEVFFDKAANEIVVTEQGIRRASLDRTKNTFWIDNGSIRRDLNAPQGDGAPAFAGR